MCWEELNRTLYESRWICIIKYYQINSEWKECIDLVESEWCGSIATIAIIVLPLLIDREVVYMNWSISIALFDQEWEVKFSCFVGSNDLGRGIGILLILLVLFRGVVENEWCLETVWVTPWERQSIGRDSRSWFQWWVRLVECRSWGGLVVVFYQI